MTSARHRSTISRAPAPTQKKPEATTNIVVMGDAMADWLALGLEEAFSEKPEIGIVRKHRTESGLIQYDGRRDAEWAQIAKEIIAAEKPKFIVMMVGNNDRQAIREQCAGAASAAAPKSPQVQPAQQAQSTTPPAAQASTRRRRTPSSRRRRPLQMRAAADARADPRGRAGPLGIPHREVGGRLYPAHRHHHGGVEDRRRSGDLGRVAAAARRQGELGFRPIMNEIFRSRAEKAEITYVDIWDGFVDEFGRFNQQGPDYEGQTRRLRSGDGVFFTKFGARKLAHYVEREIQRHITNRAVPVALPIPVEPGAQPGATKPGGPAQRPAVGPVIPLTASATPPVEELMGGGRPPRQATPDPVASRVLTKGEPITAPTGRADDFAWPRGSAPIAEPVALQPTPPSPADAVCQHAERTVEGRPAGRRRHRPAWHDRRPTGDPKQAQQKRMRQPDAPRPPFSIFQGFFR